MRKTYFKISEINGPCLTDGFDRNSVIDSAAGYYEEKSEEEGDYGPGERDMILSSTDEETGEEKKEVVTIYWDAIQDTYDHGRFDYQVAIGAI